MTISRAQMRRQLYMGGGIASLEPRQQYGLGSIVKSVKKAVSGIGDAVGDIVSSDAGKLALLAAGGYYLGGGTFGGFAKPFSQTALGQTAFGQAVATPFQYAGTKIGGVFSKVPSSVLGMEQVIPGASVPGMSFGTKAALGIGGASLLGGIFGSRQEALDLYESDRSEFNARVQQYVKNLNPSKRKKVLEQIQTDISKLGDVSQAEELFRRNVAAEGGRVGLANGGLNTFGLYQNYLNELQDAQQQSISSPLYNPTVSYQTDDSEDVSGINNTTPGISAREAVSNIASNVRSGNFSLGNAVKGYAVAGPLGFLGGGFMSNRGNTFGVDSMAGMVSGPTFGVDDVNEASVGADASAGGAAGAAAASAAGANDSGDTGGSFAEGGIPSIPTGELRENAQGIQELDYRQDGGFVPVGIKEKADDVPAMLSRNEFVMTADAVRGMGNGSIENGAQKMYSLMKSLESRIA